MQVEGRSRECIYGRKTTNSDPRLCTASYAFPSLWHQTFPDNVELTKIRVDKRSWSRKVLGTSTLWETQQESQLANGCNSFLPWGGTVGFIWDSLSQTGYWQWVTALRSYKYPVSYVYGLWLFGDSGASCIFCELWIFGTCWFFPLLCMFSTHILIYLSSVNSSPEVATLIIHVTQLMNSVPVSWAICICT